MRWDRLFDDLEAQFEAAQRDEFDAEVADRTRRELAVVHMVDRLAASTGRAVQLTVLGVGDVAGSVACSGDGWTLLVTDSGHDVLIRLDAVLSASGMARDAAPVDRIDSALGLGDVLRCLARDRAAVIVGLTDGAQVEGTIDRVGADFVDVAVHPVDEPRRAAHVIATRTLRFGGIALVRSR